MDVSDKTTVLKAAAVDCLERGLPETKWEGGRERVRVLCKEIEQGGRWEEAVVISLGLIVQCPLL